MQDFVSFNELIDHILLRFFNSTVNPQSEHRGVQKSNPGE